MSYSSTVVLYDGATALGGMDPTVAYTTTTGATASQGCAEFNTVTLHLVLAAGTAPTSVEVILEGSNDAGTTWAPLSTKAVGAGLTTVTPMVVGITYSPLDSETAVSVGSMDIREQLLRVKAKRTGGAADTRVYISAFFSVS